MSPVEGHATEKPKVDTSVKVPPAVKAAADRAEALMSQQKASKDAATLESGTGGEARPSIESKFITTNFDPANPKPPELPLFQSNQPPAQPSPQPPPEPPQPPQPSIADIEHQFRSAQGRYTRAEEDNRRMAAQIADMQRLFATLQSAPPAAPPNPSNGSGSGVRFDGPIAGRRYVQPKEEQEYGPELIDIMGRRTMEVVEPVVNQLQAEIAGLKRQLGGVQRSVVFDAQEKMYGQLAQEVNNWNQINEHPEFHRWLSVPDPASGRIRQELLSEAYGRNEASRVAHFFKSFLQEHAPSPSMPSNGAGGTTTQVNLAQFAAPGRAKPGQTNVGSPEKPVFTTAEIKQFYSDSAQGKYTGREQDYNAIQKAIFEAMNENRIRR